MEQDFKAKELALTAATLAFFLVAVLGIIAGAEAYIAALRGLAASAVVAFAGRFPARVLLDAMEPPAPESSATPAAQATPAHAPEARHPNAKAA